MKLYIFLLLFCLNLVASTLTFSEEEKDFLKKHPVIKISNERDWLPFDFMIGSEPAGYSIDILKIIEKKLGVKFEFVNNYSWSELWNMFKNKQIDILHPVIEKEERKKYGFYTESFFEGSYVFITKSDTSTINSIEDLYGKVICVPEEWARTKFLQKNFPQIKLMLVQNMKECYSAVKHGDAYATIELDAIVNYIFKKNMNTSLKINSYFKSFNKKDHKLHFLVRKDLPILYNLFENAYNSIDLGEISEIQKKWFPKDNKENNDFTKNEKDWLAKNSFIKLAYVKYWDDSNIEKLHKEREYIKLLSKYSNIGIQLVFFDTWKEAYAEVKSGNNIQGILFLTKDENSKKYFDYLPAYFFMPSYILIHKDNKTRKLKDLENQSIYVRKGSPFNEFIKNLPYKIKIISTNSEKEMFENLANVDSKVKAGISNRIDQTFFQKNHIKVAKKIYNEFSDVHVGINKKYKEVFSILKKAHENIPKEELTKMKNTLFQKGDIILTSLERKYLHSKDHINLCLNPNWMPFSSYNGKTLKGMVKDYTNVISKAINKNFEITNFSTWQELDKIVNQNKCDIVSFVKNTDVNLKNKLVFSKTLANISYVIVASKDKYFIDDIELLSNEKFSILGNTKIYDYMKKVYPNLDIKTVNSVEEGLQEVLKGNVYGFIDTSASISHIMENKKYHNFKIINKLDFKTELSIGVNKDDKYLRNIILKTINSISDEEIRNIYNKQVFFQKEKIIDYSLLWKVVSGGIFFIAIIIYRNREIKKHNKKLKESNKLLQDAQKIIEEKNKELETLSTTDKLTGINNRAKIDEFMKNEIKRCFRYKNTFSFCILDIDYFKKINDTYGHQKGDMVLQNIAKLLKKYTRDIDFVGRWGGEEFVILCPETKISGAQKLCENLRKEIEKFNFSDISNQTASIGISGFMENDTIESLTKRADDALYEAKRTGRNKVIIKE